MKFILGLVTGVALSLGVAAVISPKQEHLLDCWEI